MVTTTLVTLADFERLGEEAEEYEVIDGVLERREGMGRLHGRTGADLTGYLWIHVRQGRLGELYTSDTNVLLPLDPLVLVKPDVAFIRADRLPPERELEDPLTVVPDLVVEVRSPGDRPSTIDRKIERYRRAGVPLVWLVRPRERTVTVFAQGQEPRVLGINDVLDGGDVLPDFRLALSDLFG
jgi:Uma2 family endonuclease